MRTMKPLDAAAPALLAALLMQGCGHAPPRPPLVVQPLLRIDDARATLARQIKPARRPDQAAPATEAAAQPDAARPGVLAVLPSRLEIVQLAPNEYRLQYRPSATPATLAVAVDAAPTPAAERIQIVNGNGVRGMGERVRRLLARHGIAAARVVNQRGHYQRATIIEYVPGQRQRADAMLAALQGRATLLPARALPDGLALRLVLGRDSATGPALAALDAATTAAPARLVAALDDAAVPHFNQE